MVLKIYILLICRQAWEALFGKVSCRNDARVITNLKREGANIFGKTVTAEFAVHEPGPTLNPYNSHYTAGTSSTGSAVAVATGMVPTAIGFRLLGQLLDQQVIMVFMDINLHLDAFQEQVF